MPYGKRKRVYASSNAYRAKRTRYGAKRYIRKRKAWYRRSFRRRRSGGRLSNYRKMLLRNTMHLPHYVAARCDTWGIGTSVNSKFDQTSAMTFIWYPMMDTDVWKKIGQELPNSTAIGLWENKDNLIHRNHKSIPDKLQNIVCRGGRINFSFTVSPTRHDDPEYSLEDFNFEPDMKFEVFYIWVINGSQLYQFNNQLWNCGFQPSDIPDFNTEVGKVIGKRTIKLNSVKTSGTCSFKVKPHCIKDDNYAAKRSATSKMITGHDQPAVIIKFTMPGEIPQVKNSQGIYVNNMQAIINVDRRISFSGDAILPEKFDA
ncbi:coat protein [Janusivirus portis]|uniref:Coat protein n=1 Tax=Caesalpinia pluviosa associated gemycircularvirus TaxID=2763230 RepID=A0A7G8FH21_9VIRU|nr:coat protein [Caesalpinia pluviosa associated gemycircularvirus]